MISDLGVIYPKVPEKPKYSMDVARYSDIVSEQWTLYFLVLTVSVLGGGICG